MLEVLLVDTTLVDAASVKLGGQVVVDPGGLPARFQVRYDPAAIEDWRDYSLEARITFGGELIYINDTAHPVLTRGAPANSDVRVISLDPFDRCVEPLPGKIFSNVSEDPVPDGAELRIRLVDVTEPGARNVVTETLLSDVEEFPVEFELPHEGVSISRHNLYELEAELWIGDRLLLDIPHPEWRAVWLPHCPAGELELVNELFPLDEK